MKSNSVASISINISDVTVIWRLGILRFCLSANVKRQRNMKMRNREEGKVYIQRRLLRKENMKIYQQQQARQENVEI